MLSVEQLAISYNNTKVVSDISFALKQGEIGCLLGPSGCGKTSILRAVCGFVPVSHGAIYIDGEKVSSPDEMLPVQQRNVGMVFQDYALFPHLTVAENVGFGLSHLSADDKAVRVQECLSLVGMQALAKRMPHALSGGQQQRVALARALAPKPRILLMDEPFSSLDVALRDTLANDVRHILKEENITGLLVTHDQKEAFAVADEIGVISDGSIHQWGNANQLYNAPANEFVASFIGEGVIIQKQDQGENALVLIRPEQVSVKTNGQWSGSIISRQFRGSYFLYQIRVDDLTTEPSIVLGHGDLSVPFDIDENVHLDIDLSQCVNLTATRT